MTARSVLVDLLGHDVIVTNPRLDQVMARGRLIGLADHPTLIVTREDGRQITLPQEFRVEPDLTSDARKVIAELERYEEEHGHQADGWPCLREALAAARQAVPDA